jgi:hypothetical protein
MPTAEETKVRRKRQFLKELERNGGHVAKAAKAAGVSHTTMYVYRDEDPEFAAKWEVIQDLNVERLEAEVDRRAFEGVERNKYYKGDVIGVEREFSDNLLMFRLKALRPEKYRDVGVGKNSAISLTDKELDDHLEKMIARRMGKVTETPNPDTVH